MRFSKPPLEFDALERELDRLEPAWADFVHGLRTAVRYRRDDPASETMLLRTYVEVAVQINAYRERVESGGDPTALLHALILALDEAVPVPYWIASAVRDRVHSVLSMRADEPRSLHSAFDLDGAVPLSKGHYARARADLHEVQRLYRAVSTLMQAEGLNLTAALRRVLRDGRVKLGTTKARQLFERQDRIQRIHMGKRTKLFRK